MEEKLTDQRISEIKRRLYNSQRGDNPLKEICLPVDDMIAVLQEIDESRQLLTPLQEMICEADASVRFVGVDTLKNSRHSHFTPIEAGGKVNVVVSNSRTNWQDKSYTGESYIDAVSKAARKCRVFSG